MTDDEQRFRSCKHFCFTAKHIGVFSNVATKWAKKRRESITLIWAATKSLLRSSDCTGWDKWSLKTKQIWQPVDSRRQRRRRLRFLAAHVAVSYLPLRSDSRLSVYTCRSDEEAGKNNVILLFVRPSQCTAINISSVLLISVGFHHHSLGLCDLMNDDKRKLCAQKKKVNLTR